MEPILKKPKISIKPTDDAIYFKSYSKEFDFLSNFYPCVVKYKGLVFDSVEKAYQCVKFLYDESSPSFFDYINSSPDGLTAKKRSCLTSYVEFNFPDSNECEVKALVKSAKTRWFYAMEKFQKNNVQIMKDLLVSKFTDNLELREKLIETYPKILREQRCRSALPHGSSSESFSWMWFYDSNEIVENGKLGDLLMDIRNQLIERFIFYFY